ncbi:MAG: glycogen/starch/alpha-glucan phosphorylase [Ruminococcaceae bacterium]|nr:glycogen/starch/alpha-glucan phosphorylase [Oscillospiraceae bacterium]
MNYQPNSKEIKEQIEGVLQRHFGCTAQEASIDQMYKAAAITVKNILSDKRSAYKKKVNNAGAKRVYYMCMEFLLGRSLKTNLCNLGLDQGYAEALKELGFDLEDLYEREPDAGLGNGGLGRLAACFMDSLSSLDYPATGFSLCYEYGLFKQMIVDGMQVELPDVWLPGGEVWLIPRTDRIYKVRMGGRVREEWRDGHCEIIYEDSEEIEAVPYDMMISGADSAAVSQLRLWKARDIQHFNMGLFTQGQYTRALENSNHAEVISKVLYPSDNHTEGKLLRLSQQYFLVSASIQSIIRDHMAVYGRLDNLPDKVAIHINDTHPALCVPELMRILIDDYFFTWDQAWSIVTRTVSYTNHTVMPEALETWNEDLFRLKLPRIYTIVKEINERFCKEAWNAFPGNWDRISKMSVIGYNQVRMANLSVIASQSINGVSKLHSQILKDSTFKDFYRLYPTRFDNVTNGIAHRRWLCYSNPKLASLIDECIGTGYRHDPESLSEFAKFADDKTVREKIRAIKHENKIRFSNMLYQKTGQKIDTHSVYDVQIKRLHEYKRQLLNALNIIGLYLDLKENPDLDMQPQTFLFGAKAAPGYAMAKRIIKLLCMISKDIEQNPRIREKLKVVFLENYCVSMAEALVPSAEISEQISLAGKEASGTGCMKLMINGALTIGTLDGANVEMQEAVGKENIFIFGLTADEVEKLWLEGYRSANFYTTNERLARIINFLSTGFAGESFSDIASYLLGGQGGVADPYMCLADFESYRLTHEKMIDLYQNKDEWNRMSLLNIAAAGHFAADRSIEEYAQRIWRLKKIK